MNAVNTKDNTIIFNRVLYSGFVLFSIYFLIRGDYGAAFSNAGLALIFDPFDYKIKFQQRPLYQRVWLYVHAGIVITGLGAFLLNRFLF